MTKYKLTDKRKAVIKKMLSSPTMPTKTEICRRLKITRVTLNSWIESNSEIRQFFIDAEEKEIEDIEKTLVRESKRGNMRAIEFYLTNRKKEKWRKRQNFTHEASDSVYSLIEALENLNKKDKDELKKKAESELEI